MFVLENLTGVERKDKIWCGRICLQITYPTKD